MVGKKGTQQDYMATVIGYQYVFSLTGGGLERVKRDLKKFNTLAVLQFCSKLSLILNAKGQTDMASQAKMVREIFSKELRGKFVDAVRKAKSPAVTIINEKSVALLAKYAILHGKRKDGEELNKANAEKLGILLLVLNDEGIGQSWGENQISYPVEIERERIREFMATAAFFHGNWYMPTHLSANKQIFEIAIKISKEKNLDLEKIFTKASKGLTPTEFYAIGLALLTNWVKNLKKDPNIEQEWIICIEKYFHQSILPKSKIKAFFSFNSTKISKFSELNENFIETVLKGVDISINNFLVFNQNPFVYYNNDCYVCPVPRFFSERLAEGVYWIVEKYLKETDATLHKIWPEIWGKAYEVYVSDVMQSIYKENYYANFKDEDGNEVADGLITGIKDCIPFVEIKYPHWKYKTKMTGSNENMNDDVESFIKGGEKPKGLGQISNNVDSLIACKWSLPGRAPIDKRILPILIVGEKIPMDTYNRKFYEQKAKTEGIKLSPEIYLPFIILSLEDLIVLETVAKNYNTDKTTELLLRYSKLYSKPNEIGFVRESMSFKNFVFSQRDIEIGKNIRLWGEFDKLFSDVKKTVFGATKD